MNKYTKQKTIDEIVSLHIRGYTSRGTARELGVSENFVLSTVKNNEKAIEKARQAAMKRNEVNEDWVIDKLVGFIEANIGDHIQVDEQGDVQLDLANLTPEMRKAIKGFDAETVLVGRGQNKKKVNKLKVRQEDRMAALNLLCKILGIGQTSKVEVTGDADTINRLMAAQRDRYSKEEE